MFQQMMEKILQGLPMVVVHIDDIVISGHTDKEHLEYLGYIIDAEGLHATPKKDRSYC